MRITNVEARWLRYHIPEERRHTSDFGTVPTFDMALVRVDTDADITGYGEAKGGIGNAAINAPIVSIVNDEFRPLLEGRDPRDISGLWELMYNGPRSNYALRYGRGFPELGRRGLRISAISGVDMALWDILGKSLDVPVYQLLGGRCRERIVGYASGGWRGVDQIGAELHDLLARSGYAAIKMRVGTMDADVETSIARVRAAREAIGPSVRLMVDAHGTFGTRAARRFCEGVADCGLGWFEEPVNADNVRGMAEVHAATDIPIAAGESLFTRFDFRELIEANAIDILQPDPAIAGGITEVLRIAGLAASYQLTLAPHLWGSALLFAAGLHIAAAVPNCVTCEYSMGYNPMLRELARDTFVVEDGHILIPDRPGLGITLEDDFVEQHTVDPG